MRIIRLIKAVYYRQKFVKKFDFKLNQSGSTVKGGPEELTRLRSKLHINPVQRS